VSDDTITRAIKAGQLRAFRIGRTAVRIDRRDVDAWLNSKATVDAPNRAAKRGQPCKAA
jgi:excisionase family DNA binding protein